MSDDLDEMDGPRKNSLVEEILRRESVINEMAAEAGAMEADADEGGFLQ